MTEETVQNDSNESIERLKVTIENEPDSLEANLDIAEYYLKNEKFTDAEAYILKALQIDENQPIAYNHLGIIYFHKGDFANAENYFKRAINIAPDMVESYFNLGLLYQSQGRFSDALPFYKTVVTMESDNAEAYYLMGQCAMCSEMLQEAREFFKESFRLRPSLKAALDLSIIYVGQERYPEAEELLNFLIENANKQDKSDQYSNSDIESLNFTMGLVLKKQGKFVEAIKYFQKVVLDNDRHEQAFNYLGECCVEIDMEEEAESFFAKSTKLDPEYLQPIMNLGRLYFKQERYYNAILAIERFLEIKGRMMVLEGKDIEKTYDLDVEFAYEILGKAYMQIGEREKAINIWQNSLKINPSQPEIIQLINSSSNRSYTKTNLSIDD
ncbi:MAG: tetratricopeptide repeat protein [Candidatus Poribacteria bacterium]